MEVEVTRDVEAFAEAAAPFLAARTERNVMATILVGLQDWSRRIDVDAIFALGTDAAGDPMAAALRTPPAQLLATEFADPAAARELLDAWLPHDPDLPGVSGESATARAIADAWRERGGTATLKLRELMHQLTEVTPPEHPARGRLRQATDADRGQLVEWEQAFSVEADSGEPLLAATRVARRLEGGFHYVWDDDGPVSMLAHSPTIAGTARIGPVYTPPRLRGRGYATSAVAALTQLLLDRGANRCVLYTDVTNPISNRIYASIGYRAFAEWEIYDFDPGVAAGRGVRPRGPLP